MDLDKDMARLIRLDEEYQKQKIRVIAIIQYNIKLIGLKVICDYLGVKPPYLSVLSKKKSISHEQLVQIYKAILEIKSIVKPKVNNEINSVQGK